jgi:capsular polysaccharide biosynthesis protein
MTAYSSKQLAETFFEAIESKEIASKTITKFKCQCGTPKGCKEWFLMICQSNFPH